MVAANFLLFAIHVPVFYVVPFDVIGVPILVSVALWLIRPGQSQ
jgi:hypothetical protein